MNALRSKSAVVKHPKHGGAAKGRVVGETNGLKTLMFREKSLVFFSLFGMKS